MVKLSVAGRRASVSKVPQISALKFFITRSEFEAPAECAGLVVVKCVW